ncbi:hypothetical protein Leryth_016930 [Lithospermum erythrorhizon]|nr:hypothetical protein Leryth_016930 [Lithospermum erythrorhizon]
MEVLSKGVERKVVFQGRQVGSCGVVGVMVAKQLELVASLVGVLDRQVGSCGVVGVLDRLEDSDHDVEDVHALAGKQWVVLAMVASQVDVMDRQEGSDHDVEGVRGLVGKQLVASLVASRVDVLGCLVAWVDSGDVVGVHGEKVAKQLVVLARQELVASLVGVLAHSGDWEDNGVSGGGGVGCPCSHAQGGCGGVGGGIAGGGGGGDGVGGGVGGAGGGGYLGGGEDLGGGGGGHNAGGGGGGGGHGTGGGGGGGHGVVG